MKLKKSISIILTVLMLLSVMPLTVFADSGQQRSPQVKFGSSSWVTDINYQGIEGVENFYYETETDMFVIVLNNYKGGAISIFPDEEYNFAAGKNPTAKVKIIFKGDNTVTADLIESDKYSDKYYGIFNGISETGKGSLVLEGAGQNDTLTVRAGDPKESSKNKNIEAIHAYNIHILRGNVNIFVSAKGERLYGLYGVYTIGAFYVENDANLNIDIRAKNTGENNRLYIFGQESQNWDGVAPVNISTEGSIRIFIESNAGADRAICLRDPMTVRRRAAGKPYASIFLQTDVGNPVVAKNGENYQNPVKYPDGGDVVTSDDITVPAWSGVDRKTIGSLKTIDVSDIRNNFPTILKGRRVAKSFEGTGFVGYLNWRKTGGTPISKYDEIDSKTELYIRIVPKPGFTHIGLKENTVKIPFTFTQNNADKNFVVSHFKYSIGSAEDLSVKLYDINGNEFGTNGVFEISAGNSAVIYAEVSGNNERTGKLENEVNGGHVVFKWHRMDFYRTGGKTVPVITSLVPGTESVSVLDSGNYGFLSVNDAKMIKGENLIATFFICTAETLGYAMTDPRSYPDDQKIRVLPYNENSVRYKVVLGEPEITKHPDDVTVGYMSEAVFEVKAKGGDLSYQWYYDDENGAGNKFYDTGDGRVSGATTNRLVLIDCTDTPIEIYCKVSNEKGTANSNYANYTYYGDTPAIISQPNDVWVEPGDSATFTVKAVGSYNNEYLTYEWRRFNAQGAPGDVPVTSSGNITVNGNTLTVKNLTLDDIHQMGFFCCVKDTGGKIKTTNKVKLKLKDEITTVETTLSHLPFDNGVCGDINFSVPSDAGYVIDKYTFGSPRVSWSDITDGSTKPLDKTDKFEKGHKYECEVFFKQKDGYRFSANTKAVFNGSPATYSNYGNTPGNRYFRARISFTVGEKPVLPVIMTQPVNATVTENTPAKFSVKATGENLKYQWYISTTENGSYWRPWSIPSGTIAVDFTGLTESEVTFKKTKLNYSGKMKFKCEISNAAGTVETNEVFLYVTGNEAPSAPVITKQPASAAVKEGENVTFTVSAEGTDLNYRWYKNGAAIDGATGASYTFTAALGDNGAKYACVVSNSAGTVKSNEATLTVAARVIAPTVKNHPADASVKEGENVTFTVSAEGTDLNYRWYKNGAAIDGATGASYTFTAALGDNGAKYACVVSNSAGTVKSNEATLTVTEKSTPKPMLLLGNVSEEGKGSAVSVSDARLVLRAAVALESFTGIKAFVADVDGKDGITVADARLTLRMAVSLDPLKYSDNY